MSQNKTVLELFWQTMEACGVKVEDAINMIKQIEKKNNYSVENLKQDIPKGVFRKNLVKLDKEVLMFLDVLKRDKQIKNFAKLAGMGDSTIYTALRDGFTGTVAIKKIKKAMEVWQKRERTA